MNFHELTEQDRLLLRRFEDLAQSADKYKSAQFTQFCDPHEGMVFQKFAAVPSWVNTMAWGGYGESERSVVGFFPDFLEPEPALFPVCALRISGLRGKSHREVLGSVLGLGISRGVTGDIIIDGDTAVLFALEQVEDFLLMNLERIGRDRVSVECMAPEEVYIPPKAFEEISGTVASLRLDCVLGLGARLSRAKAYEAVASGLVQVNWSEADNPSMMVAEGDVISLRRFGRMQVAAVLGESKKGRMRVVIKKYI